MDAQNESRTHTKWVRAAMAALVGLVMTLALGIGSLAAPQEAYAASTLTININIPFSSVASTTGFGTPSSATAYYAYQTTKDNRQSITSDGKTSTSGGYTAQTLTVENNAITGTINADQTVVYIFFVLQDTDGVLATNDTSATSTNGYTYSVAGGQYYEYTTGSLTISSINSLIIMGPTITAAAGTGGTASIADSNGNAITSGSQVKYGTSVTLTATPAAGYLFKNWTNSSGAQVSTNATYKPTVNTNATYTANFEQAEASLTTSSGTTYGTLQDLAKTSTLASGNTITILKSGLERQNIPNTTPRQGLPAGVQVKSGVETDKGVTITINTAGTDIAWDDSTSDGNSLPSGFHFGAEASTTNQSVTVSNDGTSDTRTMYAYTESSGTMVTVTSTESDFTLNSNASGTAGATVTGITAGKSVSIGKYGGSNTVTVTAKTAEDTFTFDKDGNITLNSTDSSATIPSTATSNITVKIDGGKSVTGSKDNTGDLTITDKGDGAGEVTFAKSGDNASIYDTNYKAAADNTTITFDKDGTSTLSAGSVTVPAGYSIVVNGKTVKAGSSAVTVTKNTDGTASIEIAANDQATIDSTSYPSITVSGKTTVMLDKDGNVTSTESGDKTTAEASLESADGKTTTYTTLQTAASNATSGDTVTILKTGATLSSQKVAGGVTVTSAVDTAKGVSVKTGTNGAVLAWTDDANNTNGYPTGFRFDAATNSATSNGSITVGAADDTTTREVNCYTAASTYVTVSSADDFTLTSDSSTAGATISDLAAGQTLSIGKYNGSNTVTVTAKTADDTFSFNANGNVKLISTDSYATVPAGTATSVDIDGGETVAVSANNTGDTVIKKADNGGSEVTLAESGDAVTVNGVSYTAASDNTTIAFDKNGNETLTSGALNLAANTGAETSNGNTITNAGTSTVILGTNLTGYDGKDAVFVAGGGSFTVKNGDKTQTYTAAGDVTDAALYLVDNTGNVTLADGTSNLADGQELTGASGQKIGNPASSGNDTITVEASDTSSADLVTVPAGGKVAIGDTEYDNAGTDDMLLEVTSDADGDPVVTLEGGSVTLNPGEGITVNGAKIDNPSDSGEDIVVSAKDDGTGSVTVQPGGSFTYTDANGVKHTIEVPTDGNAMTFTIDTTGNLVTPSLKDGESVVIDGVIYEGASDGDDNKVTLNTNGSVTTDSNGRVNSADKEKVNNFIKQYATGEDGDVFTNATVSNYVQILSGESAWNELTEGEKAIINGKVKEEGDKVEEEGGKTFDELLAGAKQVQAQVAHDAEVDRAAKDFIGKYVTGEDGKVFTEATTDNYEQILSGKDAWDALSQEVQNAIDNKLKAAGSKTYEELIASAEDIKKQVDEDEATEKAAGEFVEKYLTGADGKVFTEATTDNYEQILSGKDAWDALSQAEKDAVNAKLAAAGSKSYEELLAEAEKVKAEVDADNNGGDDNNGDGTGDNTGGDTNNGGTDTGDNGTTDNNGTDNAGNNTGSADKGGSGKASGSGSNAKLAKTGDVLGVAAPLALVLVAASAAAGAYALARRPRGKHARR